MYDGSREVSTYKILNYLIVLTYAYIPAQLPSLSDKLKLRETLIELENMKIESSEIAKNTFNPIRSIVDKLKPPPPSPTKKFLSLSLGDPTVYGNLRTADEVSAAVIKVVGEGGADGYAASVGMEGAREAIAGRYKERFGVNYNSKVH